MESKEIRMNKANLSKADKEFTRWELFLNNVIGLFAFNSALSSLGTQSPAFNASLSLIFLGALYWLGKKQFPVLLGQLRKKKNRSEHEEYFLAALETKKLGIKSVFTRYSAFTIGYFFLISIVVMGYLASDYLWIYSYLYGA